MSKRVAHLAAATLLAVSACATDDGYTFLLDGTNQKIPLIHTSGPTYEGFIFPAERGDEIPFSGVDGFWTPSAAEIEEVEQRLRPALQNFAATPESQRYWFESAPILEHLSEFRRQYVGIIEEGSKRILLNACPRHDEVCDRLGGRVFVLPVDGGFWYWRVTYDVETQKFVWFRSNGYA